MIEVCIIISKCDNKGCENREMFFDFGDLLCAMGDRAPLESLNHRFCDDCTIRAMVDEMRDEQMQEGDIPEEVLEGNSLLEIMG